MKHDDELKNKNEQSRKLEEIKDVQAAMLLTDDEVSEVAGGAKYWQKVAGFAKKAAPQEEPNLTLYD